MIDYIIVAVFSVILAFVSNTIFIFFIMIDKDETEYYQEIGTNPPFEDIRGDEAVGVLILISVIICKIVVSSIGIKSKWVYFISAATIVVVSFLICVPLEKLYYKIKYNRYPHLKPKDDEESDNE